MSNNNHNLDDLLDDDLHRLLAQSGFIFPKTDSDFENIRSQAKAMSPVQPDRLKDPYSFLGKRSFSRKLENQARQVPFEYIQRLAQAAREGSVIPDDIKKKMEEDKQKSREKKDKS